MNSLRTDISRRTFVERFAQAAFGVTLLPAFGGLRAAEPAIGGKAKSVIFLYMRGGISHIDTFDPKPGKPEMAGVNAIKTSADGVQISEWFPRMARQMHHVSLVRSMTSTQGIHDRGTYLAHTSYFMTPTITHPSLGSWAVKVLGSANAVLPGNILINGSPQHPRSGYMPTHLAPLPITDPGAGLQNAALPSKTTESDFARRTALARAIGERFVNQTPHRDAAAYLKVQQDAATLMKSEDLKVFDISREDKKTQAAYGTHTFGKGCLLARRLVESGVRFVEVEDEHNWDTHNDQVKSMENMTPTTDQTMAVLLEDLHQRGLLASTLVVMATEFGRSPQISTVTNGRGHHPGVFTWWLAGGGVKGGYVYGKSDATGEHVAEKPVTMQDCNATIAQAMGIDLQHVEHSPSGRPFTVADKGKAVTDLFA
ncbi:DUF1501 domain-containing protein [Humisphaera borealis]|uniref:DUF1501 domain-containing protein n=1 Tax=Humisphaera borealis TaxID=2807512 RepID=A0A7M2X0N4_9BACT|nr:DUF1501 domain-containing protein [Humisphaera borealis]QOV91219.1 DUF1501 domain-containing protein [Humisphaera borealis]